MTIGEVISEYRKDHGLSMDKFAKLSGLSKAYISILEKNKTPRGAEPTPSIETFRSVAEAIGMDIDELIRMVDGKIRLSPQQKSACPMGHIDTGKTKTVPYSPAALDLAKDFDTLDSHGQSAVRGLMDEELNRMADLDELAKFQEPEEEKVIPLYLSPSAAGIASPIFGEEYEDYTIQNGEPKGAVFAVKVQGNSMEPYFPDGSIVFCNKDSLRDGDIGVFIVDGAGVIKQYHKEGGIVYLFSLNRKRADADVILPPSSGRSLVCQGRVITKRRYPVPGK